MIELTRLDGDTLLVNPHSIRTVARLGPNSSVHFGSGATVVVSESPELIAERIAEWEADVLRASRRPADTTDGQVEAGAEPAAAPATVASARPLRHLRLVR